MVLFKIENTFFLMFFLMFFFIVFNLFVNVFQIGFGWTKRLSNVQKNVDLLNFEPPLFRFFKLRGGMGRSGGVQGCTVLYMGRGAWKRFKQNWCLATFLKGHKRLKKRLKTLKNTKQSVIPILNPTNKILKKNIQHKFKWVIMGF